MPSNADATMASVAGRDEAPAQPPVISQSNIQADALVSDKHLHISQPLSSLGHESAVPAFNSNGNLEGHVLSQIAESSSRQPLVSASAEYDLTQDHETVPPSYAHPEGQPYEDNIISDNAETSGHQPLFPSFDELNLTQDHGTGVPSYANSEGSQSGDLHVRFNKEQRLCSNSLTKKRLTPKRVMMLTPRLEGPSSMSRNTPHAK